MNQPVLVAASRAAALLLVAGLPSIVVAAPSGDAACHVRAATPLEERVERESLNGVQALGRFIRRTRVVFQLDLQTEVAKIDARRQAEQDCIARGNRTPTIGAVDEPAWSVATTP